MTLSLVEILKEKEKTAHDLYVNKRGVSVRIKPLDTTVSHDSDPFYGNAILNLDNTSHSHKTYGEEYTANILFSHEFGYTQIPFSGNISSETTNNYNNINAKISGDIIPEGSILLISETSLKYEIKEVKMKRSNSQVCEYILTLSDELWD